MTRPQQPEIHRSGRGDTDQEGRRIAREVDRDTAGRKEAPKEGRVPPENRPGNRPEKDQDKPDLG